MTVLALEGAAIPAPPEKSPGVATVVVADEESAARALRLAMGSVTVVIHAVGPRHVLDALYDDLRRVTRVEIRTEPEAEDSLEDDERGLLSLLASGMSVREAAAALHLSPRTADRRLASARRKLGAKTTTEAIVRAG